MGEQVEKVVQAGHIESAILRGHTWETHANALGHKHHAMPRWNSVIRAPATLLCNMGLRLERA